MTPRCLFDNKKISGDLSSPRDLSMSAFELSSLLLANSLILSGSPPYLALADIASALC
jgi:hypothetical protein